MTAVSTAATPLATPPSLALATKIITSRGVAFALDPAAPTDKGELAFSLWKATFQAINTSPIGDGETGDDAARWKTIDRLEADILADLAPTPRAAERKLWVALAHDGSLTDGSDNAAACSENLSHFIALGDALDWNVRFHVGAIAALRRAQGRA
ncbi:hypothetical protein SPAN111604_05550 [Sphingomonas antarctica]|uniref:hypothetical protein n=1 Tax=Sphingomonas antarctica TaxID=2040274 RepID=UPI0039EB52EE